MNCTHSVPFCGQTQASGKRIRDRLDPDESWVAPPWALPPDSLLRQDLCAPEKIYDSDGFRFRITPKKRQPGMPENQATLTEKLGRSPDRGDAVVYLHWGVLTGEQVSTEGLSVYNIKQASSLPGPTAERPSGCDKVIGAVCRGKKSRRRHTSPFGPRSPTYQPQYVILQFGSDPLI